LQGFGWQNDLCSSIDQKIRLKYKQSFFIDFQQKQVSTTAGRGRFYWLEAVAGERLVYFSVHKIS
jgi:hypothetical protein